ncbi:acyl carrier protein [Sphingomonas bacterium]|uniref:acyl carrier protein n=1 Tax=Sphingomonas bacterium TaxID=1895847 RepID=UPI001575B632|nr:acyl carrier protein [Sphingomonas bacterium]
MADAISEELSDVFRDIFDDNDLVVHRHTSAKDVAGWDSLRHLRLILAVECAYRLRLPSTKVSGLKNVGELADLIDRLRTRAA